MLKIVIHVLLFLLAVVLFFVGLGVGLQFSSTLGSVLWIAAIGVAILNTLWIVRTMSRKSR